MPRPLSSQGTQAHSQATKQGKSKIASYLSSLYLQHAAHLYSYRAMANHYAFGSFAAT
jgi:hypothetical protein